MGAKIYGKYIFKEHSQKKFEKNPSLKISDDPFLVIDNFKKI